MAEGATLSKFIFDELKQEKKRQGHVAIKVHEIPGNSGNSSVRRLWKEGCIFGEGQNFAKELMEMPANLLTPKLFTEKATEKFSRVSSVEVIVRWGNLMLGIVKLIEGVSWNFVMLRSKNEEMHTFGLEKSILEQFYFKFKWCKDIESIFSIFHLTKLSWLNIKWNFHFREKPWIEEMKMGAFLSVAKGSCELPYLLEMKYFGAVNKHELPLLLVGKGLDDLNNCFHQINLSYIYICDLFFI